MTANTATYAEIEALGNGDFAAGLKRWLAGESLPAKTNAEPK
jgi:hypothetical protein